MTDRVKGKPKLLVTRKLPGPVEDRIQGAYDAVMNASDQVMNADEICRQAEGCAAVLVTPTEKCSADLIARLPESVAMIATFSVGHDHIDLKAAAARGLMVSNTPDVLTGATADIAMLLLLGAARGAGWGEKMVRTQTWEIWRPTGPLGVEVTGKRLGIYGMGRIGRAVAVRARAFDMEIHYHNRNKLDAALENGAIFHRRLDDLMAQSDFLSINCASTRSTRNSINAQRLAALPDGAVVINTARGDIVDDDALIAALKSGKLAGAGLDVFRNEPDIDPQLRALENTFLLPHLGSATIDTRTAMGMRALDNLDAFFAGRAPGDAVA